MILFFSLAFFSSTFFFIGIFCFFLFVFFSFQGSRLRFSSWVPLRTLFVPVVRCMQIMTKDRPDVPMVPPDTTLATWTKYMILSKHCENLSIAKKREMFAIMRNEVMACTGDHTDLYHMYLPRIGFSLGECALFHTISEHLRKHQAGK